MSVAKCPFELTFDRVLWNFDAWHIMNCRTQEWEYSVEYNQIWVDLCGNLGITAIICSLEDGIIWCVTIYKNAVHSTCTIAIIMVIQIVNSYFNNMFYAK